MRIERQRIGTVEVLIPNGALVDDDAQAFCKMLLEHTRSPSPRVVVSLSETPYLDSTALEGLLDAADDLSERALPLNLVNVTGTCREIFELTGLSERFRFFHDVNDAVKSFL